MCGISGIEMAVILIVAILVVGPDKVPALARDLSRLLSGLKQLSEEVNKSAREYLDVSTEPERPARNPRRRSVAQDQVDEIEQIKARKAAAESANVQRGSAPPKARTDEPPGEPAAADGGVGDHDPAEDDPLARVTFRRSDLQARPAQARAVPRVVPAAGSVARFPSAPKESSTPANTAEPADEQATSVAAAPEAEAGDLDDGAPSEASEQSS